MKKTKEFFSKHDWLAGVLAIITTIVIVNISFNKGVWDAVVDTVKGIWNIITHPIDTLKNTLYSIMHPIETVKAIWKTISDSWKRDVVNGNASSRARWFGYAIGQVVLSIVGTKGADKLTKISKVAAISRVAKVSKVTGISKGLNIVQKGMRKFHIPETVTKIKNGSLKLGQFLSKNKVAASIFTVLGVFGGFLWHESDAIANAVNKITVAAEKYEIKSVFKNAEKCFAYQPAPKYFASVNEPFLKCFYAADGQGGVGTTKNPSTTPQSPKIPSTAKFASSFEEHLIKGNGIGPRKKGVIGAHNMEEFYKTLEGTGVKVDDLIISKQQSKKFPGLYQIRYKVPSLTYDKAGKLVPSGQYKIIDNPKTVYDPHVYSDKQMIQWGKEAMQEAIKAKRVTGREVEGFSSNGMKFHGYLNNQGEITNFFPEFQ